MLLDRYGSDPEFWAIIEHLALEMEPELAEIDSILEVDGVRVLSHCLKHAQTMVQKPIQIAKETFRDRKRSARSRPVGLPLTRAREARVPRQG